MADEDLMGDGATSNVVETRLVQTDHQTITVTHCTKGKLGVVGMVHEITFFICRVFIC